ncbi:unnamed protein product [Spirodela intermedia]|uniref:Uncharacterized protein n=1 Tax=Spirodela intermedia TaxID=51605 RepID=A0A7I8JE78_SPIIN|nr:unnamed protein product [Spirodela intermedia]CAA6667843.1 unnamed protein product [Spirodela intermedia]
MVWQLGIRRRPGSAEGSRRHGPAPPSEYSYSRGFTPV